MRLAGKHMGGVLRAVLVWGMGVQILLGLAWLIRNITGLQNFQESSLLLAGESGADGFYSGVLYRGLAALLSSRPWILYGMQLAAAITAGYGLMSCLIGRSRGGLRLFCALALTTVPQAMQCHLAVLPWSLGTSLLLAETALWRRIWEKKPAQVKLAVAMLLGWVLILLILPIYGWFALPMLLSVLWRTARAGKGLNRLFSGLAALALLLCSVTVNCGWDPSHWNRKLAADALSRGGWPYFQYTYEEFPQTLHDEIGLVTAREVSAYADGVDRVLIPKMEEMYGAEKTTALLWKLAGICLRDNPKVYVKNFIWDMAAYHATPPILAMQFRGRAYDSYSGINYEEMRSRTPLLTKYYVTYGGRWWWVMLALAAGIWVCGKLRAAASQVGVPKRLPEKRSGADRVPTEPGHGVRAFLQCWFPVLAGMEWMILNFVLSGSGIMDYKKTLWVTIFWYVLALWSLAGGERSGE